ncbi:MAG: hypothetical protein ACD_80C00226G0009 [uncultured bacterium (gcode 4)]|uniref:Uncharacterized protein n=1 Tax=uncultured bacterium (gcode 4) TaxID=1234023 RepID=K1XGU4_9BACT|nr:MAG: hypothetical protein ACD_80C00226G0009 [uncultured bacterium (gcode 4)]
MRKSYKLLRVLNSHGAVDKSTGLNIPKLNKKRTQEKWSYQWLLFSSKELDDIAEDLVNKWYLSAWFYNDYYWSKLVITDQWMKFVTEYLNKARYAKIEKNIIDHKRLFLVLWLLIALVVYLISWCKITDGFSAVDCTKTLIQK